MERWGGQYEASKTDEIPSMSNLMKYLKEKLPKDEDSKRISLVHGDYRLDNIIFHPTEPRVLAILDWELSTIGHPSLDFVYNAMTYYQESDHEGRSGLKNADVKALGIPTLAEYIETYQRGMNRTGPVQHYEYILALCYFRLAAICQGIYKRFQLGNASNASAGMYGAVAAVMADPGWSAAQGELDPTSEGPMESRIKSNL